MNTSERQRLLGTRPLQRQWAGEPMLGGWYTEAEIEAAERAIRDSMDPDRGFGFMVEQITRFEEAFAAYVGTRFAISVGTASIGLDMAMRCLDLEEDDEVICPAVNFKAAPLAVLGQGGRLILAEVDERTLQLDPADVEQRLTPRTRAILAVHMNGLSAPMDDLLALTGRHPHPRHGPPMVIGDAARACGGGYRGTKIGKRGWMTVFSFHTMKLMTTLGEGGMITTDDEHVAERLRAMRQWGGSESWGSSYKITKVQAAVGLVQLGRLDEMLARRVELARGRTALLAGASALIPPWEPADCEHTFYLYTMLTPPDWPASRRDRLIEMLQQDHGIGCLVANKPVYDDHALIRHATAGQHLPRSDALGARIFCPSLHPLMTPEENAYIAAAILDTAERCAAV